MIAGLIIICIPLAGRLIHQVRQARALKELDLIFSQYGENSLTPPRSAPNPTGGVPDPSEIPGETGDPGPTPTPYDPYDHESFIIDGHAVIGVIDIPAIRMKSPVVEGVDLENLAYAIGHFPGTAFPGTKGNSVLAGHRSYTFGSFFNRLDELKPGDEIRLQTKKGTTRYTVSESFLVEPDDISVLKSSDDTRITLITCHPIYVPTHRLIVIGIAD